MIAPREFASMRVKKATKQVANVLLLSNAVMMALLCATCL